MKQLQNLLLIGGISTVPGLADAQQANEEKTKNILMILVDDLKPNLGCYGDPYKLIECQLPESTGHDLTRKEALFENTRLFPPTRR